MGYDDVLSSGCYAMSHTKKTKRKHHVDKGSGNRNRHATRAFPLVGMDSTKDVLSYGCYAMLHAKKTERKHYVDKAPGNRNSRVNRVLTSILLAERQRSSPCEDSLNSWLRG